jgi:hypothetical protein
MDIRDTEGYILDPHGRFGNKFCAYFDGELITPPGFPHQRQLEYLESDTLYTLYAGMRGSGKTYVSVWDNLFTAYRAPGCEQIFFRKTLNELRHTVISEFMRLPETLRGHFTDSLVSPRLVLPNQSVIHFASINTYEAATKYQGRQFTRITFDEWALLPYEWWSYVAGSARSPVDHDVEGYPMLAQIKGLSNPGGPGSDTLRRMFGADCEKHKPKNLDIEYNPKQYSFVRSELNDNPVYREGTPAGDAYRENLKSKPPALRAAWLEGKWTGHEGMYFDTFHNDFCKVPHDKLLRLLGQQYFTPIFLGIDVGIVHHAYVCWNAVVELPLRTGQKRTFIVTFDELAIKGASERQLAGAVLDHMRGYPEMIQRVKKVYLSPETFGEASRTRARVIGDVFVTENMVRPIPAKTEKHSRVNGLRSMYTLLADKNVLLEPLTANKDGLACDWLISDRCELLLSALPWATSDPDVPGDIMKEGDAIQLDILDGARYAVYTHRLLMAEKPAPDVQRDRLVTLAQANSPITFSQRAYGEYIASLRDAEKPSQSRSGEWARGRHRERS